MESCLNFASLSPRARPSAFIIIFNMATVAHAFEVV